MHLLDLVYKTFVDFLLKIKVCMSIDLKNDQNIYSLLKLSFNQDIVNEMILIL